MIQTGKKEKGQPGSEPRENIETYMSRSQQHQRRGEKRDEELDKSHVD